MCIRDRTRAHFEAAVLKVKGSLDRDALENSERQAWEMLYNPVSYTHLTLPTNREESVSWAREMCIRDRTRAHFEAAVLKVKGSLDRDALENSERQAWEMLYNPVSYTHLTLPTNREV